MSLFFTVFRSAFYLANVVGFNVSSVTDFFILFSMTFPNCFLKKISVSFDFATLSLCRVSTLRRICVTFKNIGSKLPFLQTSRFIDSLSTKKCFSVLKSFRSLVSCKLIWHVLLCIVFSTCVSSYHSKKNSRGSVFVNLPALWNAILKSKIVCC